MATDTEFETDLEFDYSTAYDTDAPDLPDFNDVFVCEAPSKGFFVSPSTQGANYANRTSS